MGVAGAEAMVEAVVEVLIVSLLSCN